MELRQSLFYSLVLNRIRSMSRYISQLQSENFLSQFNIIELLQQSVFYPAAGIDGLPISILNYEYRSFIHVDYSESYETVRTAMEQDFQIAGYRLVGIERIPLELFNPNRGYQRRRPVVLNEHERNRLNIDFIRRSFNGETISPFAIWAVYEYKPQRGRELENRVPRFSILHIGGEACATFEALYLENRVNPAGIAILNPAEGYGDNWTLFTHPEFRLFQMILRNAIRNGAEMPKTLITNSDIERDRFFNEYSCFWPLYIQDAARSRFHMKNFRPGARIHRFNGDYTSLEQYFRE